ncbi:MAG: HlyD family efflux transporter periplasmic adaptor subunit [Planctomycetota bacterium]
MRSVFWVFALTIVFAAFLFFVDPQQKFQQDEKLPPLLQDTLASAQDWIASDGEMPPPDLREVPPARSGQTIRAAGVVRGASDPILLRSLVPEKIIEVNVEVGDRVRAGQLLVRLSDDTLMAPRDAAAADLESAQAAFEELVNGARQSEVDALESQRSEAAERSKAARQTLMRIQKLFAGDASSKQELDRAVELQEAAAARVQALDAQLKTLTDPPRQEHLRAAEAAVRAAKARLTEANARLAHTRVTAPVDGVVLNVHTEVGALSWPEDPRALVEMVDDRQRRILAEVDEYDAIRVRIGQSCQVICDAASGIVATGEIDIVGPGMRGKTIRGEWAGERNDTHVRPVWIRLDDSPNLPIGLPVEVTIIANEGDEESPTPDSQAVQLVRPGAAVLVGKK